MELDILKKVVNTDAIENGAWLHLKNPVKADGADEGEPLFMSEGRPCRVRVRSHRSSALRRIEFKSQTKAQAQVRRAKSAKVDGIIEEAAWLERPRRFAALVVCFENVSTASPGEVTMTEVELVAMASSSSVEDGNYQWVVDQVMDFAYDDSNFGGTPEGEAPSTGENSGKVKAPKVGA